MNHTVINYVIGAVAIGLAGTGVYMAQQPKQVERVFVGQSAGANTIWGALTQPEVDAITAGLKRLKKRQVAILCSVDCSGLALDLDNAFESAKWESGIEQLVVDENRGINVVVGKSSTDESRQLLELLNGATGGRFSIGAIDGKIDNPDRLAVVISRRGR